MKKKIKLITIITILIIFIYIYKYIYEKYNIGIPCLFYKITHLYCPGCGITRAIFALLELNIKEAIQQNVLILLTPLIIIYVTNCIRIRKKSTNEDPSKIFPKYIWNILLGITILFGIIRNISYFSWLQPL